MNKLKEIMNWSDTQAGTLEFDGIVSVYDDDGNMIEIYKKIDEPVKKKTMKEATLNLSKTEKTT